MAMQRWISNLFRSVLLVAAFLTCLSDGRKVASPELMAGGMAGLIKDYHFEMQEMTSPHCSDTSSRFRSIDGTCNNRHNLGAAYTRLNRLLPAAYDDGISSPRVAGLPLARNVSRSVFRDPRSVRRGQTLLFMQWGQFLDHDMSLTPLPTERVGEGETIVCCRPRGRGTVNPLPEECFPIRFPRSDRTFIGTCMEFVRSIPAEPTDPADSTEQRQHMNVITSFIDASSVYGSSLEEEEELREADGHGFLLRFERSSQGALLPRTEREICITRADEPQCFLAGDERVNEQPQLATIHTIFLRLHNKIAQKMAAAVDPGSVKKFNETIFQSTRRVVGAIVQNIMYGEWLPIVLGQSTVEDLGLSVEERSQFDPEVNPSILSEFSTAAYRFGHSMIPRRLPAVSRRRSRVSLRLRQQFLRPEVVRERFNDLALGLVWANRSSDQAQAVDSSVSREVTRHLFEPRRRRGFDLVSFNIQRGRDHGIPAYNDLRQFCGLWRITSFGDPALGDNGNVLSRLYDSPDDIDLFAGGLSEPPFNGGQVGETFNCIIGEQMYRLKFGDRFFFTHDEDKIRFTDVQLAELRRVTAAVVMCVAVPSIPSVQENAFLEPDPDSNPFLNCEQVRRDFLNPADFIVEA